MVQFALNPAPKPSHKRKSPKRGNRGTFDTGTRKRIIERDNGLCVKCGAKYEEIHHIIFRSQGGAGTDDNGVCVCHRCHELAHKLKRERKWFENYRNIHLLAVKT
jgi:5-methylcytosine-specific restriction endonuclease McrA